MLIGRKAQLSPVYLAILAALLFGASTPAAKLLTGYIQPQLLAGLLYLGSGLGLFALRGYEELQSRFAVPLAHAPP